MGTTTSNVMCQINSGILVEKWNVLVLRGTIRPMVSNDNNKNNMAAPTAAAAGNAAGADAGEPPSPKEERRRALQRALVRGMIQIEAVALSVKHFIVPENSLADKLPFFRCEFSVEGACIVTRGAQRKRTPQSV